MVTLKSSSLAYAIIFLLFIGLFTTGIVLLSGTHKVIEVNSRTKENVAFNTVNNINWFLSTELEGTRINSTGDTSILVKSNWGAWDILYCKSFHNRFQFEKFVLTGVQYFQKPLALYLADTDQKLSVAGQTRIEGLAYLPKRGVERAYIGGQNYSGEKLIYGEQKVAQKKLPELLENAANFNLGEFLKKKNLLEIDQLSNSINQKFSEPTVYYQSITPVFISDSVSGNVVIHSFDSIFITKESYIDNAILVAPIIRIEAGFTGSVQIEASQRVTIENNVLLNYPSTIRMTEEKKNTNEVKHGVYFQGNSELRGGILIISKSPNFRNLIQLNIDENSLVAGLIYNQGESDVKGTIIGSLYTYKIVLESRSADYSNHLLNAYISSEKLPKNFISPNWLKTKESSKSQIIDWL